MSDQYIFCVIAMSLCLCLGLPSAWSQDEGFPNSPDFQVFQEFQDFSDFPSFPAIEIPTWDALKEGYRTSKERGAAASEKFFEWAKDDMSNMGAWEYKIVRLSTKDPAVLEKKLNAFGQNRWECFWVQKVTAFDTDFFMKKQKRSYFKAMPSSDFLKWLPGDE